MRVAIYARVSTREQTPENQLQDLRRYCQARGWEIVKEFVDHGISGAKEDRPALTLLLSAARQRRIDVVLVWRFDRFARSLRHLINALGELRELGVDFVSYTEGLDTSTGQGRLLFGIVGAISEFERELIRERILSGLRRARAQGIRLGRPPRCFDTVKARQLRDQGASFRQIAAELGVDHVSVYRTLKNPQKDWASSPTERWTERVKKPALI